MSAATSEPDRTEAAHVAALASLPGMGPATLVGLLAAYPPRQAWAGVRAGRIQRPPPRARAGAPMDPRRSEPAALFSPPDRVERSRRRTWAEVAGGLEPVEWWQPHANAGTGVTWLGRPDFPAALGADPRPPGALFWRGRIEWLDRPCVAIVGTRAATLDGRSTAFRMARDLAAAGVCVVSGLALGIDGAAHAGALAAVKEGAPGSTVGVAASGPDVAYPRRHARLWRDVTACGAIISENLPGRPAQAWRFPTRNRIIAGLVSLVVVVESHRGGGSLVTAEAAIERGVEVRVVPGPVHSPASEGSNQLLYDGPGPVRHAQDVLDALGDFRPDPGAARSGPAPPPAAAHPRPDTDGQRVLDAVGWRPASTGQIMARTGLDAATVARCLDRLTAAGLVGTESGWWSRRP
jgi:DNA processing protein